MSSRAAPVDTDQLLIRILGIGDRGDSLAGRLALSVAKDIIIGRIPIGHDLNSIELARKFETSRTPVREGLMILESAGLVTIPPRRRPFVASLTAEEIEDIYELRGHLYSLLGKQIVDHVSDAGIEELGDAYAAMVAAEAAGDLDGLFWANVAFHELAERLAPSAALRRSIDSLGAQVLRLRHVCMFLPGLVDESQRDHARLMLAYRERDRMLAAALNQAIVRGANISLQKAIRDGRI